MTLDLRFMIRRDLPAVIAIESMSFPNPWTEEQFVHYLRQRNTIGMVAEWDHQILGFQVYEFHPNSLNLINLAVCPNNRREGVGAAMVAKLTGKLSPIRSRVVVEVSEENLAAHLFFKSQGFRATRVLRDHFEGGEAAYQFVNRLVDQRVRRNIEIREARK